MNPDIKEQWVAALRSGEYQQGVGNLHNASDNLFCCLGVLCELAVKADVVTDVHKTDEGDGLVVTYYDYQAETLPRSVVNWAGLRSTDPSVPLDKSPEMGATCLSELNDGGYTFMEIADLIEEKL